MRKLSIICILLFTSIIARSQTATLTWGSPAQRIDGFGASDEPYNANLTTAQQQFYFGTGTSNTGWGTNQLGLTILRTGLTNGNQNGGDCSSVSSSCAGTDQATIAAVYAAGGEVISSPWSPPASMTTNGSTICSAGGGGGSLSTGSYSSFAQWIVNYVKSVATYVSVPISMVSVQNEPDQCQSYDSALYTAAQMDTFVKSNLGPAFVSNSLSTLIGMPENGNYGALTGTYGGTTCAEDSSCSSYVGVYNWHDYGASLSGYSVTPATVPSGWASGKKWYETEASCLYPGPYPSWCTNSSTFDPSMADALRWAAVIDQRMQDGANAWLYWVFRHSDNQGLTDNSGNVAQRAYVLAQYSKFIRPGYYRIAATHIPQTGVTVSAYNNGSNAIVIVATNQNSSSVSQTFSISGAPSFAFLTPVITSASQSLAVQSTVSLTSNSFSYTLPAQSVTTFYGTSSGTTINASSCSESAVAAALSSVSSAGANVTVNIPAGTCAWTSQLSWSVPSTATNLTIQGQTTINCSGTPGSSSYSCTPTDSTVIQDSISTNINPWQIALAGANTNFRMTGLTIEGGSGVVKNNGILVLFGPSHNVRLDHIHFNVSTYTTSFSTFTGRLFGEIEGVMDHDIFTNACTGCNTLSQGFAFSNTIGDGVGNGDGTWANPTNFGSNQFMFLESSIIYGGETEDCDTAGRFVVRYNSILWGSTGSATIHTHGTKTQAGRGRGCRAFEAYNNYIQGPTTSQYAAIGSAAGPALIWGNTLASGWNNLSAISTTRNDGSETETNNPYGWGYCGTSIKGNGVGSQWDGNSGGGGSPTASGYPCLDGLGRGQGQSLNGKPFAVSPNAYNPSTDYANLSTNSISWPNQYLEPMYYFCNSLPGGIPEVVINSGDTADQFNRDIYKAATSFTGASGTGCGLLANRPTSCTAGPGGTYGTSPTGSYGVGYFATDANSGQGELYVCTATNTWTGVYEPYVYPHPLAGGTPQTSNPTFNPVSPYTGLSTTVTISSATPGSSITYCTSNTGSCTPNTSYGSGINFSSSGPTNICAYANAAGYSQSGTVCWTGTYSSPTCATPIQNAPYSGTFTVPPTILPLTVTFTSPTAGCSMYATSDGSTPTCSSAAYPGGWSITSAGTYTYRVIACQTGYSPSIVWGGTWQVINNVQSPQNLIITGVN